MEEFTWRSVTWFLLSRYGSLRLGFLRNAKNPFRRKRKWCENLRNFAEISQIFACEILRNAKFRILRNAKCEISQFAKCEMRNFAKCEMRNAKTKFREMWKIFNFSGNAKLRIFRNETFSSNYISKLFVCHNCCRAVYFFSKQRLYKADGFEVNIYFSLPATKSNVKDSTFYQPDLSRASCGCQLSSSKM